MIKSFNTLTLMSLYLFASQSHAVHLNQGHFLIEMGAYYASQGKNQQIDIEGLIGDNFSVSNHHNTNALIGVGYLLPATTQSNLDINYGINAFYLFDAQVNGTITQEHLFENLAYHYDVHHLPVYATAKARMTTKSHQMGLTIDAGIGPNFITTHNYTDWSIDGGMTLPDHAFSGKTKAVFSATAGIGLEFNNVVKNHPIELGYRFFYLGEGQFNKRTNQLLTTLTTGNNYANALVLTVKL